MALPRIKVKEGMKEEFEKRVMEAHRIATGIGWDKMAELMASLKVDHHIFGHKIKGNQKQRNKKYGDILKQVYLEKVFEVCEPVV